MTVSSSETPYDIDIFLSDWEKGGSFSNQVESLEISTACLFIQASRKSSCCSLEERIKLQNFSKELQILKIADV